MHPPNTEILVYAQIEFDCSPTSKLTGDDLKNFEGIMFRHDHLRRNVKKIDYGQYTTRDGNDGRSRSYTHILNLKLVVDSASLWETPRSYIWRHIGRDEWKLVNGTVVTVNRIHTK